MTSVRRQQLGTAKLTTRTTHDHPDIADVLRETLLSVSQSRASAKRHFRRLVLDFPITSAYKRDTRLDTKRTTRDENFWQRLVPKFILLECQASFDGVSAND